MTTELRWVITVQHRHDLELFDLAVRLTGATDGSEPATRLRRQFSTPFVDRIERWAFSANAFELIFLVGVLHNFMQNREREKRFDHYSWARSAANRFSQALRDAECPIILLAELDKFDPLRIHL